MEKPEPIRVGVQGFSAFGGSQGQGQAPIRWERIQGLPAFQMFLNEEGAGVLAPYGLTNSLYADYCRWHAAKGLWPNETPEGDLL